MPIVLLVLFVLVAGSAIIALIVYAYLAEQKRLQALEDMARRYNLQFSRGRSGRDLDYDPFHQGDNRYFENTLSGSWDGRPLQMGDFHYSTHSTDSKGNRTTTHHNFSYCHLRIEEAQFSGLFIRPEGFFDKLTALVGFDDIDFESAEFSKKFYVKAPDRKFAYDIVSQKMMDFLLADPVHMIYLDANGILVLTGSDTWKPDQFPVQADFTLAFLKNIPEYAWEQWKA